MLCIPGYAIWLWNTTPGDSIDVSFITFAEKEVKTQFTYFNFLLHLHHKQKLRTIVRIDEDVTQLREKMQEEKKRIAAS